MFKLYKSDIFLVIFSVMVDIYLKKKHLQF